MIQFKRGKSLSWHVQKKPLADGQPGYDKDRKKIKIGDGKHSWSELPDASGLKADEILDSEANAKVKVLERAALRPISTLLGKLFHKDDRTLFTYGTEAPDENTIGQVYFQHYDAEPEVDYIVEYGTQGIWQYQKYRSGFARCWGTAEITTDMINTFENSGLFSSKETLNSFEYPFTFLEQPHEVASVISKGGVVWLANTAQNSTTETATYLLLSIDELSDAVYRLTFNVEGFWRKGDY